MLSTMLKSRLAWISSALVMPVVHLRLSVGKMIGYPATSMIAFGAALEICWYSAARLPWMAFAAAVIVASSGIQNWPVLGSRVRVLLLAVMPCLTAQSRSWAK